MKVISYGGTHVCECGNRSDKGTSSGYCDKCKESRFKWECPGCQETISESSKYRHRERCEKWFRWNNNSKEKSSKLAKVDVPLQQAESLEKPFENITENFLSEEASSNTCFKCVTNTSTEVEKLLKTLPTTINELLTKEVIIKAFEGICNSTKEELKEFATRHENTMKEVLQTRCDQLEVKYNSSLTPFHSMLQQIEYKVDSINNLTSSDSTTKDFTPKAFITELDVMKSTFADMVVERDHLLKAAIKLLDMKKTTNEYREALEKWKLELNKLQLI